MDSKAFAESIPASPAADLNQIQQRQDEIFRERQRQQQKAQPDVRLMPEIEIPSDDIPEGETPCFVINDIQLKAIDESQASADAAAQFTWALRALLFPNSGWFKKQKPSPVLDKCYGTQGINVIMRRLQNLIISKGYVTTRILVGPQDLTSGVLEITIIPGRIREIKTDRNKHLLPLKEGAILNLRHIEQALENLKNLPSVRTDFKIVPAEGDDIKPGESDLIIFWEQGRPWHLTTSLDNSGSDATGKHQGHVSFSYDNLANLNDHLSINLSHKLGETSPTRGGTKSYGFNYRVPIKNWALSLSASRNQFHQITKLSYVESEYIGKSENASIKIDRLLFRNQYRRLIGGTDLWQRASRNFSEGKELRNQRRKSQGYQFFLNYREFIGRSILNSRLAYIRTTEINNQDWELRAIDGRKKPEKVSFDVSLDAPFNIASAPFRYFSQVRYQKNFAPLPTQDFFTIGNRYSVRTGNQSSSLSAERGWMIRNDLEWMRAQAWARPYIGLDYGEVRSFTLQPKWKHLAASVVGIKGQVKDFSYELSLMSALSSPNGFQDTKSQLQFTLNQQF